MHTKHTVLSCNVDLYGSWLGINRVVDSIQNYSVRSDYRRIGDLGGCEVLRLGIVITHADAERLETLTDGQGTIFTLTHGPAAPETYPIERVGPRLQEQGWQYGTNAI